MQIVRPLAKGLAANLLPATLFNPDLDLNKVRILFKQFVRVVEVENHSYCNRLCSFCPNSFLDRRGPVHLLDAQVWDRILEQLSSIKYKQTLVWSRYHEPLADQSIIERVAQARVMLPAAWLTLISNGDYLNPDLLHKLEEAGANRLMVDLYLPEGESRTPEAATRELIKFLNRTGLAVATKMTAWDYRLAGSSIDITLGIPLYDGSNISDRGGLIALPGREQYQRTSPCFNPLHSIVIDFNGKGMLCCQVRSDAPQHQGAIIGDLSQTDYTVFSLYRDLATSRRELLGHEHRIKTGVCKTCVAGSETPFWLSRFSGTAALLSLIPARSTLWAVASRRFLHRRYEDNQ